MDALSTARVSWDQVWMAVADTVAHRSKCSRRWAGCALVSADQKICATGFNGAPSGWPDGDHDTRCREFCPRATADGPPAADYEDCVALHAEINALMFSDRSERAGGTAYVTTTPCFSCAKALSNSGLARVVCVIDYQADAHRKPSRSVMFMKESGLEVVIKMPYDT